MYAQWLPTDKFHNRWLGYLHLLYVAFFALVLPFICWGAQGSSPHPHNGAHFVFVAPPEVTPVPDNAADWLASNGAKVVCSFHTGGADNRDAAASHQPPVGKSTPSLVASTLLLIAGPLRQLQLDPAGIPNFDAWATPHISAGALILTTTPPPR